MTVISKDITEHKQAEQALQKAYDELEFRVRERTTDLTATNKELQQEITNRIHAEEQIMASLKEKEVLLKEIHHRVKNNLQIISSLLDMRIMRTDNQQVIDLFEETRSKIHTLALIHTQLYRSERFDQINMGAHIQELVDYLSSIYVKRAVSVTPIIEHSDVYLSVTQAIPCALV